MVMRCLARGAVVNLLFLGPILRERCQSPEWTDVSTGSLNSDSPQVPFQCRDDREFLEESLFLITLGQESPSSQIYSLPLGSTC